MKIEITIDCPECEGYGYECNLYNPDNKKVALVVEDDAKFLCGEAA